MRTAKFMYKCRLCGKIFSNGETSENLALDYLLSAMYDYDLPHGLIGGRIMLIEIHSSCEKGVGVGDLLGYEVSEDD